MSDDETDRLKAEDRARAEACREELDRVKSNLEHQIAARRFDHGAELAALFARQLSLRPHWRRGRR